MDWAGPGRSGPNFSWAGPGRSGPNFLRAGPGRFLPRFREDFANIRHFRIFVIGQRTGRDRDLVIVQVKPPIPVYDTNSLCLISDYWISDKVNFFDTKYEFSFGIALKKNSYEAY